MGFRDEVRAYSLKIASQERDIFTGVVDLAHESIVEGSPVTGSPGQPVDTGNLKASWVKEYVSKDEAVISTNVEYAPYIEDGGNDVGKFILRSETGGFHSVGLTRAGFNRVVDTVTQQVVGNESGSAT